MSTILRVYGENFDVSRFLATSSLKPCAVFHKGRPKSKHKPGGPINDRSGIHVVASEADFDEFPRQVRETTEFLKSNRDEIHRLLTCEGVEPGCLDFGIERTDEWVQCHRFPPELLLLAGSLGLEIEISVYQSADESSGTPSADADPPLVEQPATPPAPAI